MEFGKRPDIETIDWTLPPDDPGNAAFLRPAQSGHPTQFFIGAPAWGHKEWVGKIYPPNSRAVDFLYHYSRVFNCIELNTTHYRIPTSEQIQRWVQQVPKEFIFCPKIPKAISHDPRGLLDRTTLKAWLDSLSFYGPHLGPCFLQLPPHFRYEDRAELANFLTQWPNHFELALELRHPSWFQDGHVIESLTKYLRSRRIGLVITDVAGRRDVLHSSLTAPFTFIRFIGNELHPSDFHRAKDWVGRLATWQTMGLSRTFFIVHQPDDLSAPDLADFVIRQLNETCAARLQSIAWTSLFDERSDLIP